MGGGGVGPVRRTRSGVGRLSTPDVTVQRVDAYRAPLHQLAQAFDTAQRLAALWLASVIAIAAGPAPGDREAAADLRAGGSPEALLAHATSRAAATGLGHRLVEAAETVGFPPLHRG